MGKESSTQTTSRARLSFLDPISAISKTIKKHQPNRPVKVSRTTFEPSDDAGSERKIKDLKSDIRLKEQKIDKLKKKTIALQKEN